MTEPKKELHPAQCIMGDEFIIPWESMFLHGVENQFEYLMNIMIKRFINAFKNKKDVAEVLKRHGLRVQIKYEPLTLKGTPCPGERLPKCEQESTSSESKPEKNNS